MLSHGLVTRDETICPAFTLRYKDERLGERATTRVAPTGEGGNFVAASFAEWGLG